MKILIVDDEDIQRQKLVQLISESPLSFSDILCAPEVPTAIDIIETHHPDIVLSDIRMPVKNGLDLAQYVKETYPEILVILITGYSEFKYAQAAIRYNVFDYILKPIDAESTLSCIRHAIAKLEAARRRESNYEVLRSYFNENESYIQKQFLQELLFWSSPMSEDQLLVQKNLLHIDIRDFRLVVIKCHFYIDSISNQIEEKYYYSHLAELAIKKRDNNALLYNIGDAIYWIYPSESDGFSNYAMMKDMELLLNELKENDVLFQISISSLSNNFNHLNTLRRQITICQSHYENHPNDSIIFYDDLSTKSYCLFNLHEKAQFLSTQILAGNVKEAAKCLDSFSSDLSESKSISEEIFFFLLSSLSFTLREITQIHELKDEILNELSTLKRTIGKSYSINPFFPIVTSMCRLVNSQYQANGNTIVELVLKYIKQNYNQSISLTSVSEYVQCNPSYVSRLIRQHTGKNFTIILTELRIEESKHLLKETNKKITEISDLVGYPNQRYFNRVFSSYIGMSPNDYRKITQTFN